MHNCVLPVVSYLTAVLTTLPISVCRWAFEAIVLAAGLMPDAELSVAVVGVLLNIGLYPTLQLFSVCLTKDDVARAAICTKLRTANRTLLLLFAIHAGWTCLCTADTARVPAICLRTFCTWTLA